MARQKTGVGPVYTAQVMFMDDPKIVGEVEAWRAKRKISIKSAIYREIFHAGLDALRPGWAAEHGNPSRAKVNAAAAGSVRGEASKAAAARTPRADGVEINLTGRPVEVKPARRAPRKTASSKAARGGVTATVETASARIAPVKVAKARKAAKTARKTGSTVAA